MVAKLAVIIIAIGATFGALLVNRQQRIDAVAEISRSQLRMAQHDKTIMRLQAAVAQAVRPEELRVAAFSQPVEWQQIPYRFDPFRSPTGGESAVAGAIKPATGEGRPGASSRGSRGSNVSSGSSGSRGSAPERRPPARRVADSSSSRTSEGNAVRGGNR